MAAVKQVPFLAAFEDFFLLRGDLLADLEVYQLLLFQKLLKNVHNLLADRVPIFDELNVVAIYQNFGDGVRKLDDLTPAQSHLEVGASGPRGQCPAQRRISLRSRAICAFTFLNISW